MKEEEHLLDPCMEAIRDEICNEIEAHLLKALHALDHQTIEQSLTDDSAVVRDLALDRIKNGPQSISPRT